MSDIALDINALEKIKFRYDLIEKVKDWKLHGYSNEEIARHFGLQDSVVNLICSKTTDEILEGNETYANTKEDIVSHPSHYQSETGLEVIDVIEAFVFDLQGIEATDTGNILKYMCRWKKKNGLEDLKKARWYLDHLIAHIENKEKENVQ